MKLPRVFLRSENTQYKRLKNMINFANLHFCVEERFVSKLLMEKRGRENRKKKRDENKSHQSINEVNTVIMYIQHIANY
jgi:hypothetical protein